MLIKKWKAFKLFTFIICPLSNECWTWSHSWNQTETPIMRRSWCSRRRSCACRTRCRCSFRNTRILWTSRWPWTWRLQLTESSWRLRKLGGTPVCSSCHFGLFAYSCCRGFINDEMCNASFLGIPLEHLLCAQRCEEETIFLLPSISWFSSSKYFLTGCKMFVLSNCCGLITSG